MKQPTSGFWLSFAIFAAAVSTARQAHQNMTFTEGAAFVDLAASAPNGLLAELGKPAFHQVQPLGVRGGGSAGVAVAKASGMGGSQV